MQPPPEMEPDEVIGEFLRGKEIGKGSFATVYLAKHRVSSTASHCAMVSSVGIDGCTMISPSRLPRTS
jgi:serine/threonine protein kinase